MKLIKRRPEVLLQTGAYEKVCATQEWPHNLGPEIFHLRDNYMLDMDLDLELLFWLKAIK